MPSYIAKPLIPAKRRFRSRAWILAGFVGLVLVWGDEPLAWAHKIVFKDGFTIYGTLRQQHEMLVDPNSGERVSIPRGSFMLDDYARIRLFSHVHVAEVDQERFQPGTAYESPRVLGIIAPKRPPAFRDMVQASVWNSKWERDLQMATVLGGQVALQQRLRALSPHCIQLQATTRYHWLSYYLTREWEPEKVRNLLAMHADLKLTPQLNQEQKLDRRGKLIDFLLQAQCYDEAERELQGLAKDFPGEKAKIDEYWAQWRTLHSLQRWEEIQRAMSGGQWNAVHKLLEKFPEEGGNPRIIAEVRTLRGKYATAMTNLKLAQKFLAELPQSIKSPAQRDFFSQAATSIHDKLHVEHFFKRNQNDSGRLDPFLQLAQQAARIAKAGGKPDPNQTPEHLLSLAITGWWLGGASAEARPAMAERIWRTQQFLLEYLKPGDESKHDELMRAYQNAGALSVEEVARMIPWLPPAEPEKNLVDTKVVRRLAESDHGSGTRYYLQLPPEYRHERAYPVLLVMHDSEQEAKYLLDRWSESARQNGYILAAPVWKPGAGTMYDYTADEHRPVLDVLRDLRRHFQVDSDRVFLSGFGEGGTMAYDVGLSHPGLFAGVIPINGYPNRHVFRYWHNGQYLPFYAVWGTQSGEVHNKNNSLFKEWIPSCYPMLGVEYRGRGQEWFGGEVQDIFDWMNRKKRFHPLQFIGKDGSEFQTMRSTDNRFYWLEIGSIAERCLNEGDWRPARLAATICARVVAANQINISVFGIKKVTVWLGPEWIDFAKPVHIRINLQGRVNQQLKPSLSTLLDDLCERADRQQLYMVRLELRI